MTRIGFTFLTVLACLLIPLSTVRGEEPRYDGARFEDLEEKVAKAPKKTLVTLMLPASDGFRPNVTLVVQDYPEPLAGYITLSEQQLNDMFVDGKWTKLFEQRAGEVSYRLEATGFLKSRPEKKVHTYSRAFKKEAKVYVVTAIALESQWDKYGKKLKLHAEAFKGE